jgi:hypothetical protein
VEISSTDPGTAWFLLAIALVVQWLIIWSAARVAFGHALARRPTLVAMTRQTPEGLVLTVSNRGTVAAANMAVRWRGQPEQQVLASSLLLAVDERVETVIAPGTEAGEMQPGVVVVRYVDGGGSIRTEQQLILAPASVPESAMLPRRG